MTGWLIGAIAGCARGVTPEAPSPVAADPPALRCPEGTSLAVEPPGAGIARIWPDTEVYTCRDPEGSLSGPQLERWQGGGIAAEGAWAEGGRDGAWTSWFPDGAFRSQISWRSGVQDGLWREISLDGRILEIEMVDGAASGIRSLPAGAVMPEWEGGIRVEGSRYRGHTGGNSALSP